MERQNLQFNVFNKVLLLHSSINQQLPINFMHDSSIEEMVSRPLSAESNQIDQTNLTRYRNPTSEIVQMYNSLSSTKFFYYILQFMKSFRQILWINPLSKRRRQDHSALNQIKSIKSTWFIIKKSEEWKR